MGEKASKAELYDGPTNLEDRLHDFLEWLQAKGFQLLLTNTELDALVHEYVNT